eukprot:TRINITY_DN15236_c0_g1_i1.p1 TRINITY_DN15236_c0_g1~~TRINITY_DN15236_c0_g1_i1.p1  ORF type:complete len:562 (+),score=69.07 TRINITY_DN15236_c0_g1_i1:44-1687(+)
MARRSASRHSCSSQPGCAPLAVAAVVAAAPLCLLWFWRSAAQQAAGAIHVAERGVTPGDAVRTVLASEHAVQVSAAEGGAAVVGSVETSSTGTPGPQAPSASLPVTSSVTVAAPAKDTAVAGPPEGSIAFPALPALQENVEDIDQISSLPGAHWLGSYSSWHKRMLSAAGTGEGLKYVVLCVPGGMGNQILALTSAVLFSILAKRMLIFGYCGKYKAMRANKLEGFSPPFQWHGNDVINETAAQDTKSLLALDLTGWNQNPMNWQRLRCSDFAAMNARTVVMTSNMMFGAAILQNPLYNAVLKKAFPGDDVVGRLFRDLFRLDPELLEIAKAYKRAHFTGRTVALQMRLLTFNESDFSIAKHCYDNVLRDLGEQDGTIYLAVPKRWQAEMFKQMYPKLRVLRFVDHAAQYGMGELAHPNFTCSTTTFGNSTCSRYATLEAIIASLADEVVITPWSTYGYLMSLLSGRPAWELPGGEFCRSGHLRYFVDQEPCRRLRSTAPCFHAAHCFKYVEPLDQVCPLTQSLAGRTSWAPFFRYCGGNYTQSPYG